MSATLPAEDAGRQPKRPTERQRALAARVRVNVDKRLGRETEKWIVELAKKAG